MGLLCNCPVGALLYTHYVMRSSSCAELRFSPHINDLTRPPAVVPAKKKKQNRGEGEGRGKEGKGREVGARRRNRKRPRCRAGVDLGVGASSFVMIQHVFRQTHGQTRPIGRRLMYACACEIHACPSSPPPATLALRVIAQSEHRTALNPQLLGPRQSTHGRYVYHK